MQHHYDDTSKQNSTRRSALMTTTALVASGALGIAASRSVDGCKSMVLGIGDVGGRAIEHFAARSVPRERLGYANTTTDSLKRSSAGLLIRLGSTGLSAQGDPEVGRTAAESSAHLIRKAFSSMHRLCIVAGMGGGTGSGAAPVIARIAREAGITTMGMVMMPFEFEGRKCNQAARTGLRKLNAYVDELSVLRNDELDFKMTMDEVLPSQIEAIFRLYKRSLKIRGKR